MLSKRKRGLLLPGLAICDCAFLSACTKYPCRMDVEMNFNGPIQPFLITGSTLQLLTIKFRNPLPNLRLSERASSASPSANRTRCSSSQAPCPLATRQLRIRKWIFQSWSTFPWVKSRAGVSNQNGPVGQPLNATSTSKTPKPRIS